MYIMAMHSRVSSSFEWINEHMQGMSERSITLLNTYAIQNTLQL